jgi:quercetin dioxygenase-like cupin family protein
MHELNVLKELTNNLPPLLTEFTTEARRHAEEEIIYGVDNGVCFGYGLLHNPLVAVQHAVMTEGATFPRHRHNATEFLIPIRGVLKMQRNGEPPMQAGPGGILTITPGEPHSVVALSDVWMIGILVPGNGGYPDAGTG